MAIKNTLSRLLGFAFLLQAITSIISGAVFLDPLLSSEDIIETMNNVAANPMTIRAGIFGDLVTAIGIVFLGAMLFTVLRKQNEHMGLIAFGLYILEAGILAASRLGTYTLLSISESYVAGESASLQAMGTATLKTVEFGYTLHMVPFCIGAFLFYYLLYQSNVIPRPIALWGLLSLVLVTVAVLIKIAGGELPFLVYLPYAPFEFFMGIWILVRGLKPYDPKPQAI